MATTTEEIVRANRVPGAKFYCLRDGTTIYPVNGFFALDPFEEPHSTPPGSYQILYREHRWSTSSLPPLDPTQPHPILRITGTYGNQTVTAPQGAVKEDQLAKRGDPLMHNEEHIKNRVQFERVRMFDENITSEHLIGKRLVVNQEIGESFLVAKAWRQENDVLRRNQVRMLEEYLALGRQLAEERLARSAATRPAESGGGFGGSLSKELLSLLAPMLIPAIAKKVGLDGVADAKITDSDDETERLIAQAKRDLKEAQDQVKQSKDAPGKRIEELEAMLASALAEIAALKGPKPEAAPQKGVGKQAKPPKEQASEPTQAKKKSATPKPRRAAKQLPPR
jgi:hypothetical protein